MSNTRGRSLKRTVAGVSAGVLTLTGAAAALAVPAGAQSTFSFTRLAGTDRYATAAAIATSSFATSDNVIVASGQNFPDALAGNYLAGFQAGPILLTQTSTLPAATKAALVTLKAKNVTILGGTSAVSTGVQSALVAAGYTVTRIGGANRFATARLIAESPGAGNVGVTGTAKTAILASGQSFADALTAGPLGYAKKFPVTITNATSLSADAKAAFTSLAIKNVIIAGGTVAVSAAVEAEVKALGITVTRLAGTTRQLTAVAIADYEVANAGFSLAHVNLARGDDFADALSGGPHAGKESASVLLTDTPTALGAASTAYLTTHSNTLTSGNIFGGTAAVSDAVKTAAETAAKGTSAKSQTTRPELISAAITGTVTPATFNGTSPLGTTVTYTFDEAIASTPVPASFKLYSASDVAVVGSTFVSVVGSTVTIRFTGIDGTTDLNGTVPGAASNASRYTLATVIAPAVTDNQGQTNPVGAAAVGTATAGTTATATANTTTAPDLRSVSGFRAIGVTNSTAIDFVFDQAAFVTGTAGYNIVLLNGTVVPCTGPAQGSTTPASGGTVPGGNGTTTITTTCTTASNLTAADIARAYVAQGTVSDTLLHSGPGPVSVTNPLESVNVGNAGLTTGPDLTSATFIPAGTGTNATALDQVLFKFDQATTATVAANTNFNVFHADSTQTASIGVVQVNAASDQVLVSFAASALTNAVGASNNAGTVGAQAASVGVAPTAATTSGQTPGVVAGPQLASVALKSTTDVFNNTAFTATYTFTQAVGAGAPTSAAYRLYDSNGNTLSAPTCTVPSGATTTNTIVVCTAYTDAASAVPATVQADTGAATLGTVDAGAVTGTTVGFTGTNPEGAQATTGGTGTPAA